MENTHDWLSRLLEMIPVKGTLDYRCFLGAPWRIDFAASELGEIPYHVILGGSAVLEDPEGEPARKLIAGDILLFPHGSAHALHDESAAAPAPARQRPTLNVVFHENEGTGDRLDMMCGRFMDSQAKTLLDRGVALAMEWAMHGLVVPHVSQTIDSTVEAINAGLQSLKAGHGTLGKVAAIVDRDLAEEK